MTAGTAAITTYILTAIVAFGVAGIIKLLTVAIHSFGKKGE